jgi:hypothetical protein
MFRNKPGMFSNLQRWDQYEGWQGGDWLKVVWAKQSWDIKERGK